MTRLTSSGVARNREEKMPSITPMSWISARSLRVPTPISHTATTMSAMIGSAAITEVEMERMTVWLTARFASSP